MSNQTSVVITATDQTRAAFDSFARNLGGADKRIALLNTSLTGMAGAMAAGNLAAMAASNAFAAFGTALGTLKESALLAARYETLGVTMVAVGRNAGYSSKEINEHSESVRRMGITMIESRQTIAKLAQAQINLSEASTLARIAQDAAVIGDINSSEALARLVHGLQSAQTDVLRNIGLNVNFEASYAALAKELGKTTGELTEQEKATARLNAVKEAGARIAGTYEDAMGTAGKQLGSLQRYADDAKTKLGTVFSESLLLAVGAYTGALKDANAGLDSLTENKKLDQWASDMADTFASIADAAKYSFGALFTVADTAYTALMQLSRFTVGDYKGILSAGNRFAERQSGYWSPGNSMQVQLGEMRGQRESDARSVTVGGVKYLLNSAEDAELLKDAVRKGKPSASGGTSSTSKSGKAGTTKFTQSADFLAAQQEALSGISGLGAREIMAQLREADAAAEKYGDSLRKASESLYAATDAGKVDEMRKSMELASEAFAAGYLNEDQLAAVEDSLTRTNDKLLETRDIGKELGMTFSSAFEDAIVGGKKFSDVLDGLLQDILRLTVRKNITEKLADSIGGIDFGGLFGGLFKANALGGVYSGSGISAFSGQVVSSPTVFPFARGIGLMGEAGPEAILPLKRGSDGRLGIEGGGGSMVVNIIEAPGQGGRTEQRMQGGVNMLDVFVDKIKSAIAGDIADGRGAIPAALSTTYGINRSAGAY